MEQQEIQKILSEYLRTTDGKKAVLLCGSRARGDFDEQSDYDFNFFGFDEQDVERILQHLQEKLLVKPDCHNQDRHSLDSKVVYSSTNFNYDEYFETLELPNEKDLSTLEIDDDPKVARRRFVDVLRLLAYSIEKDAIKDPSNEVRIGVIVEHFKETHHMFTKLLKGCAADLRNFCESGGKKFYLTYAYMFALARSLQ